MEALQGKVEELEAVLEEYFKLKGLLETGLRACRVSGESEEEPLSQVREARERMLGIKASLKHNLSLRAVFALSGGASAVFRLQADSQGSREFLTQFNQPGEADPVERNQAFFALLVHLAENPNRESEALLFSIVRESLESQLEEARAGVSGLEGLEKSLHPQLSAGREAIFREMSQVSLTPALLARVARQAERA